jgi:hypothetical protein
MKRLVALVTSFLLVTALIVAAQTDSQPESTPSADVASPAQNQPLAVTQTQSPEPNLPDAPSEPARLTSRQKFDSFVKRTYSPYTFASAAFGATWAQAMGDWPTYGGGMQGWGKRYGASVANTEGRMFFNTFLLPVIFQQDPRYLPSQKHGVLPRTWYAVSRVGIGRHDDDGPMFNYSEVLSVLFMSSLQNSYYPVHDRGSNETFNRFLGGLSSDAASNVLKEFSPEIKRIARKIIPMRAQNEEQKVEQKIPPSVRKAVEQAPL